MAAIGNIPIKILAQAPNSAPIEIGVYELPVHIGGVSKSTDEKTAQVHFNVGDIETDQLIAHIERFPHLHV